MLALGGKCDSLSANYKVWTASGLPRKPLPFRPCDLSHVWAHCRPRSTSSSAIRLFAEPPMPTLMRLGRASSICQTCKPLQYALYVQQVALANYPNRSRVLWVRIKMRIFGNSVASSMNFRLFLPRGFPRAPRTRPTTDTGLCLHNILVENSS